jgi:hypothetical protein
VEKTGPGSESRHQGKRSALAGEQHLLILRERFRNVKTMFQIPQNGKIQFCNELKDGIGKERFVQKKVQCLLKKVCNK